jgi:hypothetical protein
VFRAGSPRLPDAIPGTQIGDPVCRSFASRLFRRDVVRSILIDSMGLFLRVLEGDLMAAMSGSINVDGGGRGQM